MIGVREIGFEDLEAAQRLARSVGWGTPAREDWERLWLHNPAVGPGETPLQRGWVLEQGDRVVGMGLCLPQAYHLEGKRLRAAIFAGLVVEPQARGSTMKLVNAYVRQRGPDLLLSPASAPETAKLLHFLKLSPMPQPGYDVTYYWVTRAASFLEAGLRKKGVPQALSAPAGLAGAPILWAEGRLRGRRLASSRTRDLRVLAPSEVDAAFDELWDRKLHERPALLAERTAATLRWHFSRPVADPPFFVAAYSGERLEGYAAVVRQDAPHLGLRRARIADMLVAADDPGTIRDLLAGAVREAGARGAYMVELVGFPAAIRDVAADSRPFSLGSPAWPFHWKAPDPSLHRRLESKDLWHACLFDGDGSL